LKEETKKEYFISPCLNIQPCDTYPTRLYFQSLYYHFL